MLRDLVLLEEPYIYEIAIDDDNIRCGKLITILRDKYCIASYKFGQRHGFQKFYNDNGSLITLQGYKYGLFHGRFFDKSDSYCIMSGRYIKGLPCGLWKYKYQSGAMTTINYDNDDGSGWVRTYYSSGSLHSQGRRFGVTNIGQWYYYDDS